MPPREGIPAAAGDGGDGGRGTILLLLLLLTSAFMDFVTNLVRHLTDLGANNILVGTPNSYYTSTAVLYYYTCFSFWVTLPHLTSLVSPSSGPGTTHCSYSL